MRLQRVTLAIGLAAMAGCTQVGSTGTIAMGPDTYGMRVTSRNLASAAEKGLADATTFCNAMGRQTQLLRTQITNEDYQLVFRCMGSAPTLTPQQTPAVPMLAGVAIPNPNGPVLAGQAFPPNRTVGAATAERLASQARTPIFPVSAPTLNPPAPPPNSMPGLAETPVGQEILRRGRPEPVRMVPQPGPPSMYGAASPPQVQPLAPLTAPGMGMLPSMAPGVMRLPEPEPESRGFFGRLFGSSPPPPGPMNTGMGTLPTSQPPAPAPLFPAGVGSNPFAASAPPAPSAYTPAPVPYAPASPGLFGAPQATPFAAPMAPSVAPLQPLQAPLGLQPVAAPASAPGSFAQPAPLPIAAQPAPLPFVAAQPPRAPEPVALPLTQPPPMAAPPQRSIAPLPLQPLPRLNTDVPTTLPPPTGGADAGRGAGQPVSTEPPGGFWQTNRN